MNTEKPEVLTMDERMQKLRERIAREMEKYPFIKSRLQQSNQSYVKPPDTFEPVRSSFHRPKMQKVKPPLPKPAEEDRSKQKPDNIKDPGQMEFPF